MQCQSAGCNQKAVFHLTWVERRRPVREEHLCEQHARGVLIPYATQPRVDSGTPRILQDAKEFDLDSVVISEINNQQVVYLREVGGGCLIPILTGPFEAVSLERCLKGATTPWPLTHDVMATIIRELGGDLQDVIVDALQEHVYHAKVRILQDGNLRVFDLRPSDALLLALVLDRPIFFSNEILTKLAAEG
jgi:uncharacterized protein